MLRLPTDKKYFTIMSLSHIHSTSKEETLREAKPSIKPGERDEIIYFF